MRRLLLAVVMGLCAAGPVDVWASQKTVTTDVETRALRDMAMAMPLGSRVRGQTIKGKSVNGTLMSVTADAVIIKRKTRLPEPAVTVPFSDLTRLELQTSEGLSPAKVIGIGLAAGAGAILTMFAIVASIED